MNDDGAERMDRQITFLEELLHEHVPIAEEVTKVGPATWALHGTFPVDGEVLVAEFGSDAEARRALRQIT